MLTNDEPPVLMKHYIFQMEVAVANAERVNIFGYIYLSKKKYNVEDFFFSFQNVVDNQIWSIDKIIRKPKNIPILGIWSKYQVHLIESFLFDD